MRTCDPILTQLSVSTGSPKHLKGPAKERRNPSFLLPTTPCTGKGRRLESPPCWATWLGFLRKLSRIRLSERTALPEERKLRKTMSKSEKKGNQWKSQQKPEGKSLLGFVTVISEVRLSGRSHDFIKFQQVAVPTLLHNKLWRRGFREQISHNYMTC